ncbi:hypothetical protein Tco_0885233 [Tanacetum coccineum]
MTTTVPSQGSFHDESKIIKVSDKVFDMVSSGQSNIPTVWNSAYLVFQTIPLPSLDMNCNDVTTWITNEGKRNHEETRQVRYSLHSMNVFKKNLLLEERAILWVKVFDMVSSGQSNIPTVWNSAYLVFQTIPLPSLDMNCNDVTTWITNEGKRNRLAKWYHGKVVSCALCDERPDLNGNLFFKCTYSTKIWEVIMDQESLNDNWNDILQILVKLPCNRS